MDEKQTQNSSEKENSLEEDTGIEILDDSSEYASIDSSECLSVEDEDEESSSEYPSIEDEDTKSAKEEENSLEKESENVESSEKIELSKQEDSAEKDLIETGKEEEEGDTSFLDEDDEEEEISKDSLPCELMISVSGDRMGSPIFDQDTIKIGRGAECDIVIDNLGASRVHAEIQRHGKFYAIQNVGRTGTFVNGKKVIDEHHLNNDDEIFLAKHSIVFKRFSRELLNNRKVTQPKSNFPKADERIQTISVDFKTMAKKQAPASAYMHIESKANRPLPVYKNATFFGKSSKCDIIVQGWLIHDKHALLVQEESGYALYHLGFFHPPRINQEPKPFAVLKDGDLVEMGNIRFVFQIMPGG